MGANSAQKQKFINIKTFLGLPKQVTAHSYYIYSKSVRS